jgi:hypothetical protein
MGSWIADSHVRFDFDNSSCQQLSSVLTRKDFAQQLARDATGIAIVEAPRQRTGAGDVEGRIAHRKQAADSR